MIRRAPLRPGSDWSARRSPTFLSIACIALLAGASLGATSAAEGARHPSKCFGKSPTITGTPRNDVIHGTNGRDVIMSFGGTDRILARRGNDYVCAGSGNDTVHAAEGFNRVDGGGGCDWIDGRRGPGNVVRGGDGPDHIEAQGKLDGGAGNDIVESYGYLDPSLSPVPDISVGGEGDDQIYGCGGTIAPQRPTTAPGPPRERSWAWPDCYSGGPGNAEQLSGGRGDDTVFGGGGADHLNGNDGKDALYGEDGNDSLNGGPGHDTCAQNAGTGPVSSCP